MKPRHASPALLRSSLTLCLTCTLPMHATAAIRTWTGNWDRDWATAANWNPAAVPGAKDNAIFDTGSVVITPQTTTTVANLVLGAADARLSGAGSHLVVTGSATVGTTGSARLQLDGGASFQGRIQIGAGQNGSGLFLLHGTGSGTVPSTFTGTLDFGNTSGGAGEFQVSEGARASVRNPVILGMFPGTSGEVHISGVSQTGVRSTWLNEEGPNELIVGGTGKGVFTVGGGAFALSSSPVIANSIGSEGRVSVGGRQWGGPGAEWVTTGTLAIGNAGTGSLDISGGGTVTSENVVIGQNPFGSGTALLGDGGIQGPAQWNISGSLLIGYNELDLPTGTGDLQIYAGAEVHSRWGVVGNGTVRVAGSPTSGTSSTWRNDLGIVVAGAMSIEDGGLVLSQNQSTVSGDVTVHGVSHDLVSSKWDNLGDIATTGNISVLAGGRITAERILSSGGSTTVSGTMFGKRSEIVLKSSAEFRMDRSLEVSAGGLLKAERLFLSANEEATGEEDFTAIVTGSDSPYQPSEIQVNELHLGAMSAVRTVGLQITDGARVITRTLTMENGSRINVTGVEEGLRSTLLVKQAADLPSGSITIREGGYMQVGSLAMGTFTGDSLLDVSGLSADGSYQSTLTSQGTLTMAGSTGDKVGITIGPAGIVDMAKLRLEGAGEKTILVSGTGWEFGLLRTGGIEMAPDAAGSTSVILDGGRISFTRSGEMFSGFKDGDIRLEGTGGDLYTELTTNQINVGMQGTGDLRKTGGGTLDLKAASTYSGKTLIYEGMLLVNNTTGSATGSGDVIVHTGGTLGGNGFISGNVFNSGRVAPGNSPGTLHIGGDFNQFGNLVMEIGQGGTSDLLLVGGQAKLDGILEIVSDGPVRFGEKHTLIQAENGIKGTFQDVTFSDGVNARARLIIEDGLLTMRVAPQIYSQLATTPNERALAGVLDTWITSARGDTRTVAENLDLLSEEEYRRVFNALSPSLFAAGLATSIEQSQGQMTALNQHINSRRLRPAVPSEAENPWEAWVISTGAYSPGSMSSLQGEDYSAGNFIAGIERQIVPGVTAGLFNSYGDSEGDFAGSTEIEQERFTLGAHATAQYNGSYANTALGVGILEIDVKRSIAFGNLSRKARSSTDGTEFFAMLSGGHDFREGNWIFGPTAALQYSNVRYDDVKENGAGALDLTVSNPEDDSLRGQFGGRVAYLHKANERLTLIPEARVFWQHEFLRDNETLDAAMDQGLGLGFQHQVSDSDGDSVFAGVGLGFQTDFGFYGNVSYDLEFGREGDVNQTLSVGADWKF